MRVQWSGTMLAVACAIACAIFTASGAGSAQEPRDPLIDPPEGGFGSRFQIVGQVDWTPGERVTILLAFTDAADPFTYSGPFPYEQSITVLRDATWSFPIVVRDDVLGFPLPARPGYLVVRAESAGHEATNVYVYTVDGARPAGAERIADLGFGPMGGGAHVLVGFALFAAGIGGLLVASGAIRARAGS